jgi:hypothetical protein
MNCFSESSALEQLTDRMSFSRPQGPELDTKTRRLRPAHDTRQAQLGFRAGKAAYDGNLSAEGQNLGRLDKHAADADVFGHPREPRRVPRLACYFAIQIDAGMNSFVYHD